MKKLSVLIVEDDVIIALDLRQRLQRWGHEVLEMCDTGQQAMDLARSLAPDLILMDIRLRGPVTGLEAARQIQQQNPSHIMFLTANPHLVQPFIQDNWFKDCLVISKPASESEMQDAVQKLCGEGAKAIVGDDPRMP